MQLSIHTLREALFNRLVSPGKRRTARGKIAISTEPVEQRLLLSGTEPPLLFPPTLPPPTDPGTTETTTTTTITIPLLPPVTITVTSTTPPDPQAEIDATWAANAVEYEQLKTKIHLRIAKWADQQNHLITDSFDNAEAAMNQMISFLGDNPENLQGLTNNVVNLVWAGGAYSGPYGASIGVAAVVFGIAVNTAIDSGGNAEEIRREIERAIGIQRQACRDQVSKVQQEWEQKFLEATRDAETRKEITVVAQLWELVQINLPVVEGAAPKPPSINKMYSGMLICYANERGWRQLISCSSDHEIAVGTYYFMNPQASLWQHQDWLGVMDVTDIIDELNRVRALGD